MKIIESDRVWIQGYELEFIKNSLYLSRDLIAELANFRPTEENRFNFFYILKGRHSVLWLKNNLAIVDFEKYKKKSEEEIKECIKRSGEKLNEEIKRYRRYNPRTQAIKKNQMNTFIAMEQHKQVSLSIMIAYLKGQYTFCLPHSHSNIIMSNAQ